MTEIIIFEYTNPSPMLLYISFDFFTVAALIVLVALSVVVARVGRNTVLGYWGILFVCLLLTPLIGYPLVSILQKKTYR